jgi:molybdopterin molybdotransferase
VAQLTDDCFAFSGPLLPIDEAERMIGERVTPVAEIEAIALKNATTRVLAADIVAPVDLPPFDNSAVDGYAVRHADLATDGDTRLKIVDRLTAGRAATRPVARPSASSPARRCRRPPIPSSCRRMCASKTAP